MYVRSSVSLRVARSVCLSFSVSSSVRLSVRALVLPQYGVDPLDGLTRSLALCLSVRLLGKEEKRVGVDSLVLLCSRRWWRPPPEPSSFFPTQSVRTPSAAAAFGGVGACTLVRRPLLRSMASLFPFVRMGL